MPVIDLAASRAERTPHLSGEAKCAACSHEWVAVAPVGTWALECPACSAHKGFYVNPVTRGGNEWVCNCGSCMFKIAEGVGPYCVNCGAEAQGWF